MATTATRLAGGWAINSQTRAQGMNRGMAVVRHHGRMVKTFPAGSEPVALQLAMVWLQQHHPEALNPDATTATADRVSSTSHSNTTEQQAPPHSTATDWEPATDEPFWTTAHQPMDAEADAERVRYAAAYALLGLSGLVTVDQLHYAYRQKAKLLHPDTNGGDAAAFHELTEAYDYLQSKLVHLLP